MFIYCPYNVYHPICHIPFDMFDMFKYSSVVNDLVPWYPQLGQVLHGAGHALASSGSSRGATAAENGRIAPCCSHFIRKNDDEPVDLE